MATVAAAALLRLLPTRKGEASGARVKERENERRNSRKKKKESDRARDEERTAKGMREEERRGWQRDGREKGAFRL